MSFNKILIVSMGNGGNAVATAFIDKTLKDCGVGSGGEAPADAGLSASLEIFCDRQPNGKLVPRHIMAATTENPFPASVYSALYPAEAKIVDDESYGGKNHAKGLKAPTVGTLIQLVQQRVAALNSECVVWLFHSIGGGYGSGAGAAFIEQFEESFNGSIPLISFPIIPSDKVSNYDTTAVYELYNAILALPKIFKGTSLMLPIDNGGLYDAAQTLSPTATYEHLNTVCANALSTLVSPMLWPDTAGTRLTVEAFHQNLWNQGDAENEDSDEPRTWFDQVGRGTAAERIVTISNYCDAASAENNLALATRAVAGNQGGIGVARTGRWLKEFVVIRGTQSDTSDFSQAISVGSTRLALNPKATQKRAIVAGVNLGVIELFQKLLDRFEGLYVKKSFLHWYTAEGLDELDFTEAQQTISDQVEVFESLA